MTTHIGRDLILTPTPEPRPPKELHDQSIAYVTDGYVRGRSWHWYHDCPGLRRTNLATEADNVTELTSDRARSGRASCWRCAMYLTLDNMSWAAVGPGYHYVICDAAHAMARCARCTTMAQYAVDRNVLAATCNGRVALLAPGGLDRFNALRDMTSVRALGHSAHGANLPEVSAPMWKIAVTLIHGRTVLSQALEAVEALHCAPAAP